MRALVLRLCLSLPVAVGVSQLSSVACAQERAPTETITLRQLLQKALTDPPAVLTAYANLQRIEADLSVAKGNYLPSLTLQVSQGIAYDNRQQVPNGLLETFANQERRLLQLENPGVVIPAFAPPKGQGRLEQTTGQTTGTASLDWSLINMARRKALKGAELSREAYQRGVNAEQRLALTAAAEMYVRAIAASELVADAELTHERRNQQYQGIAGLVKAGLRPPVDETRARIEEVAARYKVDVRKVEERASFGSLAVSVGRAPNRPLRPEPLESSPFAGPPAQDANALALEHRPELQQLRTLLQARQAELSAALYRRAPTMGVSGSASASYIDEITGDGYQGSQYSANAVAYLRWQGLDPAVFRSANVARANLLQAQRTFENAWLNVQNDVAVAGFKVAQTEAELTRATEVLSASQATREAQNGRYKAGVASLLELLDAEETEQKARLERIEAARNHELAKVELLSATGLISKLAQ